MKLLKTISFIMAGIFHIASLQAQEVKEQVNNNNKFSFELLNNISVGNNNLFLSPFSVSTALAMTYEGAKGKTRKEMSDVLHFPDNNKIFNESFSDIIKSTQVSKKGDSYIFNIANSLWAQQDFDFLHSYFNTINKYYNAPLSLVNFKLSAEREKARLGINQWVENNAF